MFKKRSSSKSITGTRQNYTKKSKFGNKKQVHDGIQFDSAFEYETYKTLLKFVEGGKIKAVTPHPEEITLVEKQEMILDGKTRCRHKAIKFQPDFSVILNGDRLIYIDAKSWATLTDSYMIKVKLLSHFTGIQCYTVCREHLRNLDSIIKSIETDAYIQTYSRAATLKKGYT